MTISKGASRVAAALACGILVALPAAFALAAAVPHSGFLPDYSKLEKVKDSKGSEL